MARAAHPVSIDGIEFDALIEESQTLEADVPSYPTEAGFSISDSRIIQPRTLNMTLFLTNTPVTWRQEHGGNPDRVQDVLKKLEALFFENKTVVVKTSDMTYENMAILSVELSKTLETGTSREIPISFQEIMVTESKTTTIPDSYGRSGATGTNAGAASTKTRSVSTTSTQAASSANSASSAEGGSKGSIAYNLGSAVGLCGDKKSGGGGGGIGSTAKGLIGGFLGG